MHVASMQGALQRPLMVVTQVALGNKPVFLDFSGFFFKRGKNRLCKKILVFQKHFCWVDPSVTPSLEHNHFGVENLLCVCVYI